MKRYNPVAVTPKNILIHMVEFPEGEYVLASDALELLEALKRVQEDINWMINNQKLLNSFVFDYIETVIDKHK